MKRVTLPKVRRAIETMTHEVTVDPEVAEITRRAVERTMALGRVALDAVPLAFVERTMRIERFCGHGERPRAIAASN